MTRSALGRLSAIVAVTIGALLAFAPAAAAHVAVDSAAPDGDGTTTVTLTWNHSCTPGSSTTGVRVSADDGVEFTSASTGLDGWSAALDGPGAANFSGPGIPTGQVATVQVTARIAGTLGASVTFPSIQQCGDQQTAWTDPDPASDHPAPSLIATAAILAPAPAVDQPSGGADLTEILTGIIVLAAVLGVIGFLVQGRTGAVGRGR